MNPYESPQRTTIGRPRVDSWFSRRAATIALTTHSLFVIATAVFVHYGLKQSSEAPGLWLLWYFLDFPISLGAGPFERILGQVINFDMFYTFGFCLYFLILGGLQYFIVAGVAVGLMSRLPSPSKQADDG